MSQYQRLVVGLDVGSTKIAMACAQARGRKLEVVAEARVQSKGFKQGSVIHFESAIASIKEVKEDCEEQLGMKIDSVFMNVGGPLLKSKRLKAKLPVSGEVTAYDLERISESLKQ